MLGDSVTTDHISPAGAIKKDSPAGKYLIEHGVEQKDFNSYGSRRGNHEVMMRGTFANIRLRNLLAPGHRGRLHDAGRRGEAIYDAAMEYAEEGMPLCVLAGKEYGSGSSRDWAAKGPRLLGVRFVIAESYERIHRSNLVGMGDPAAAVPGRRDGRVARADGRGDVHLEPLEEGAKTLEVTTDPRVRSSRRASGSTRRTNGSTTAHGGILHYVLRDLRAD